MVYQYQKNEYHLVLARKTWNISQISEDKEIVLLDKDGMKSKFDFLQIKYKNSFLCERIGRL